jgi:hypothetical protein
VIVISGVSWSPSCVVIEIIPIPFAFVDIWNGTIRRLKQTLLLDRLHDVRDDHNAVNAGVGDVWDDNMPAEWLIT